MNAFSRDTLVKAAVSVFGIGYVPWVPGTCGTLAGLGLYLLLPPSWLWQALCIALLFAAGVRLSGSSERLFGRKDAPIIVLDEVVGFLVTMFAVRSPAWQELLAGFALFRLFDIVKPYPVCLLEKAPRGLGVMLDDVGAGVYANIALRIFMHWI